RLGMIDQENLYGRRAVVVGDALRLKEFPDLRRIDLAQADVCSTYRSHGPCKAPAVTVEHGQRPEVDTIAVHARLNDLAKGVEVGSAIGIHYAFRIAGGA